MSAMPADALTCGSDVRPGRGGARVIPLRPASGAVAPRPAVASGLAATPRLVARHAARRDTPRDTPGAPLRLTRRGRVVLAAAAALLVAVISLFVAGAAQATGQGPSPHTARHGLVQVIVRPGQSLWSVAESAAPDRDTRAVIQQIIDLNSLNGETVFAGQQIWVPR